MKNGQNLFEIALFRFLTDFMNFELLFFGCPFVFKDNLKGFLKPIKVIMVEINVALLFK